MKKKTTSKIIKFTKELFTFHTLEILKSKNRSFKKRV